MEQHVVVIERVPGYRLRMLTGSQVDLKFYSTTEKPTKLIVEVLKCVCRDHRTFMQHLSTLLSEE